MQAQTKLKLESAYVQESLEDPPRMDGPRMDGPFLVEKFFKATVKRVLRGYPGQFSLWLNRETETQRGGVCAG